MAALDRHHANGSLHIGVGDPQNPFRRSNPVGRDLGGHAVDCGFGASHVDAHFAAQELAGGDPPQHHVRIGDRGPIAFAVTGRPRIRAGRLRTHPQQASLIDAGQRSSSRPHRMDIEHRDADGESIHAGFGGQARPAVGEAHVGRGASHVEAEDMRESAGPGHSHCAHHAARRAGEDRAHRVTPGFARRDVHGDFGRQSRIRQIVVDEGGGSALVFAILRDHFVRYREIDAGSR